MDDFEEELKNTAMVMHWLGKNRQANALILLARTVKFLHVKSVEELETWVCTMEAAQGLNTTQEYGKRDHDGNH